MAESQLIDSAILKKTQDMLGQLIRKSDLTEKLLSKPPFRFVHDVITSVKTKDLLPARRFACAAYAIARCPFVSPSVCHRSILYLTVERGSCSRLPWFIALKGNLGISKIIVLQSGTLSQTMYLEKFRHGTSISASVVYYLKTVASLWHYHTIFTPLYTTRRA